MTLHRHKVSLTTKIKGVVICTFVHMYISLSYATMLGLCGIYVHSLIMNEGFTLKTNPSKGLGPLHTNHTLLTNSKSLKPFLDYIIVYCIFTFPIDEFT